MLGKVHMFCVVVPGRSGSLSLSEVVLVSPFREKSSKLRDSMMSPAALLRLIQRAAKAPAEGSSSQPQLAKSSVENTQSVIGKQTPKKCAKLNSRKLSSNVRTNSEQHRVEWFCQSETRWWNRCRWYDKKTCTAYSADGTQGTVVKTPSIGWARPIVCPSARDVALLTGSRGGSKTGGTVVAHRSGWQTGSQIWLTGAEASVCVRATERRDLVLQPPLRGATPAFPHSKPAWPANERPQR